MNQLITYDSDPVILPKGFEWCIHNFATPSGMRRMTKLKFKDFDFCKYKWRNKEFHLFELRTCNIRVMAYCVINKINTKK